MACDWVLTASAQADYRGIVSYLAGALDSPNAALSFVNEFDNQISIVCDTPEIHALSRMPELAGRGYRPFPINNYIALYRLEDARVVVHHIFHQTQDYARLV